MSSKYFDVPWAESGDKSAIPNTAQPSGDVSYPEGWTPDYELDQVTEPTAKDVERQKENQFKFDITQLLKEIQENGLPVYDANYNYALGAYTLAGDGILYRALIANGPLTTIRNPIGDTTGSWLSNQGDLRNYVSTFDFTPGDYVKGSDKNLYLCVADNGPSSFSVNPILVGARAFWVPVKSDVRNWDNSFVYVASPSNDYAKGADGILYLALTDSGPGTGAGVVNPVGDTTGAWRNVGGTEGLKTTYLTASDAGWVPDPLTRTIRVTVTGGGGGGGGIDSGANDIGGGGAGGAGGTSILSFNRPLAASYVVVVGTGGAGGIGSVDSKGVDGLLSSFAGPATATGSGGIGGEVGDRATVPINMVFFAGGAGGAASSGDLNISGGAGGATVVQNQSALTTISLGNLGDGGASIYGGNAGGESFNTLPTGAGGAGMVNKSASAFTGQDGADGLVVIEEFF